MGLFNRKKPQQQQPKQTPPIKRDLTHLTADGELPTGWYYENREFTERIRNDICVFSEIYVNARQAGAAQEYAALKQYLQVKLDALRVCNAKDECFATWASWCVASQEDIEADKARLQYLEENMQELIKKEEELRYLRKCLIEIIGSTPGIVQSTIYKEFEPDMKKHVQFVLYYMDQDGVITREKSGRSYKLFLK